MIAGNFYPNNLHYAFAQKAAKMYMVCLTHMSDLYNRRLLEQAFILLIGTYGKSIISLENATTDENSTHRYLNQEDAMLLLYLYLYPCHIILRSSTLDAIPLAREFSLVSLQALR